jgi:hypothetical protein
MMGNSSPSGNFSTAQRFDDLPKGLAFLRGIKSVEVQNPALP